MTRAALTHPARHSNFRGQGVTVPPTPGRRHGAPHESATTGALVTTRRPQGRPARARPPGRAQQAEPALTGKRGP
jgi:hypothetical protein